MHAITVAIDLAKDVFELAFADERGRVVERKRLSRRTLARTLEQRPPLRVLMEACGSAHHWGRKLQSMGYDGPIEISKYQKFQYVREMLAKDGIVIPLPTGN